MLDQNVAPVTGDREADRWTKANALPGHITLDLMPGKSVRFQRQRIEAPGEGGFVWYGKEIDGNGTAVLVIRRTRVTGVVQLGNETFSITPAGDTLHVIGEERIERLPRDLHPHTPKLKGGELAPTPSPTPRAITITYIDVLIAYTNKARLASADIRTDARLAISMTNQAFANSGVAMRFRLVGTMLARKPDNTVYNEDSVSYTGNLDDVTSNAVLASIRTKRNALGADLVALIREGGSYCGIAWAPTTASTANAGYAYSVTTRGCIPGNTFAHETGHNMGLLHDRYVEAPAANSVYYYGYVDTVGAFRDIMSYSDACVAANVNCTRVPYYSTPLKSYAGRPLGKAKGQVGAADGARALRENSAIIAAYRTPPAAAPNIDTNHDTADDVEELAALPIGMR